MRVAILGCGYVGLELVRQLVDDHEVFGVRRSERGCAAIDDAGGSAIQADVTDREQLEAVPDVDAIVFAASSGGRSLDAAKHIYLHGLRTVVEAFGDRQSPPDQLVYTSSTGVYGDHDGDWVDEQTELTPTTDKTRVLAGAERIARDVAPVHGIGSSVVRFGGLYGPDRYRLDRYLEGPVTGGYLNMIHRDDAAGIVRFALESADEAVLLAVDNEPVDKWKFADWLAAECNVDQPPKLSKAERIEAGDLSETAERRMLTSKRCSNERIRALGYEFSFPTYREGYRAAIDDYLQ